jgi:NAD(P)-dependent dehydrogenase (short-subunit alcohol dehydrogenase family)
MVKGYYGGMNSKVILITGANNGIGLAMTQTLLFDGYNVAALDLTTENLESLLAAYPNQLEVRVCDVSDVNQVRAAVEVVIQKWEQIDIVVNNAALATFKRFEERTIDETRREFDVNYFGYVNVIAAALPHMKTRGGIIHNMSSGVGITGFARLPGYASTKGAVESLTRTLAIEFAPYGIRVNLMHPPLTNTKSASPLGVPLQALADPAIVGRNLAKQIESTKPVIASDFRTAVFLFFAYRYQLFFGKLFSKLVEHE